MSLINKMLQDLEQRSGGNPIGGGMSQQVRAVPERGGMHAAWWLVILLSLALIGACVWFLWLRTTPPVPGQPFELRLASSLGTLPSPAAQAPLQMDQSVPAEMAPVPITTPAPVKSELPKPESIKLDSPQSETTKSEPLVSLPEKQANSALPVPPIVEKREPKLQMEGNAEPGVKNRPEPALVKEDVRASNPVNSIEDAPKLTKQVKELTPQQLAENEYRKAGAAVQQGRQADAIASLEHAIELDAKAAAARQMLVGLLLQAKRNNDAMRITTDGLAIDPTQTGLTMILARIQLEKGDLHAALETLEHGLPHALERADYQAFLAALLQRDKRNKEAIEHYIVALGKMPQNGAWWMGLGISLQAENRIPEAKEAFGRAKSTNTLTPELLAFVDKTLAQLH